MTSIVATDVTDVLSCHFTFDELLTDSPRPSCVVDLNRDISPGQPRICFRNSTFTVDLDFENSLTGLGKSSELGIFRDWACSQTTPTSAFFCGSTWVATTLRNRWRIIQSSEVVVPPNHRNNSGQDDINKTAATSTQAHCDLVKSFQEDHYNHDWTSPNYSTPLGITPYIQLLRGWDWAKTALGPLDSWPPLLRSVVNLVVAESDLAVVHWGPTLCEVYNEAFVKILQDKHPKALGQATFEVWNEVFQAPESARQLNGVFERAIRSGKATAMYKQPYFLLNGEILEEKIFNVSFLPILDERGETAGLYEYFTDITIDHLNERRSKTVRKIGLFTAGEDDPEQFYRSIARALEMNENDFPFALVYSFPSKPSGSPDLRSAKLESFIGCSANLDGIPTVHDLLLTDQDFLQAFKEVFISSQPVLFNLATRPHLEFTHGSPVRGFGDRPKLAILVPIEPTTREGVKSILFMGINPRRQYDAEYESFVRGLARAISAALASVELVNEQKRLAGQAREKEERALAMIEVSPVGSFLMNMSGQMLYLNQSWSTITGWKGNDMQSMVWMDLIAEDYQEAAAEQYRKLMEHKEDSSAEIGLKRLWRSFDPGTGEPIEGRAYIISSVSIQQIGGMEYVTGAITDISAQKWMEGIQSRRRLEALELKRQHENFMDMTSHEMRNPLSAIFQSVDAIIEVLGSYKETRNSSSKTTQVESAKDPIEYVIDAARTIALCSQHQKRIIDDVLVLSKIDADLIEIHPIAVQPRVLIQTALKMFSAELAANKTNMSFEVEKSYEDLRVDWVKLDPGRLTQILINLCTNAIKFTAQSTTRDIKISLGAVLGCPRSSSQGVEYPLQPANHLSTDPTEHPERGLGDTLYLEVQVTDTGRGMGQAEMQTLFQRFHQGNPRTHTVYGGSGLGLFIARLLSRLQGGDIGVTSKSGHGTTFAFFIKVRSTESPKSNNVPVEIANLDQALKIHAEPQLPRNPSDFTVLVVEDNLVNQKVLTGQLRKVGFNVHLANNGQEALDFLRTTNLFRGNSDSTIQLSVILMDVEMPVMNGIKATANIRNWEVIGDLVSHVPIVAITANARAQQVDMVIEAGMDDVVTKPFRIPEILAKIEEFVGPLIRRFN